MASPGSSLIGSIQFVKGVGPKRAELLERLGIRTVHDALMTLPFRYEDRSTIVPIPQLRPGAVQTVLGTIRSARVIRTRRARMCLLEAMVDDGQGALLARWFHGDRLQDAFEPGRRVLLHGRVERKRGGRLEMSHPEFELVTEEGLEAALNVGRIVPVYPLTQGLSQRVMRSLMKRVVDAHAHELRDWLPEGIAERRGLMPLPEAIRRVHFPPAGEDIERLNRAQTDAHRSLAYRECFLWQLGLALQRYRARQTRRTRPMRTHSSLVERFLASLPLELTAAQKRALAQIRTDLAAPFPMNRLLQGDVGCGKTVVALLAMLHVIDSGFQAALMVPTEVLAEQHGHNMKRLLEPFGIEVGLLVSGLPPREKRACREAVAAGTIRLVVGTHALIQRRVEFRELGLVVVDEQHRFGVLQRAGLREKGWNPDVLIMTATPIPRTLGLTVFGDLDISVIDELPRGRRPITTRLVSPSRRETIYRRIREEVARGHQAFIIYPLIEESESSDLQAATTMAGRLQEEVFPDLRIGLLHGRLSSAEKQRVLGALMAGEIQVLVATTVIEVGIDVARATVIVIENAERFGLAQLHQLRGRVGRGDLPSYCFLVPGGRLGRDARRRLEVLEQTQDGFRIAEEDLAIRGPGEFLGTRQSGRVDVALWNVIRHPDLLPLAHEDATAYLRDSVRARRVFPAPLRRALAGRWSERYALVAVG
jgi:ATP-dependent DNA helicase RecG